MKLFSSCIGNQNGFLEKNLHLRALKSFSQVQLNTAQHGKSILAAIYYLSIFTFLGGKKKSVIKLLTDEKFKAHIEENFNFYRAALQVSNIAHCFSPPTEEHSDGSAASPEKAHRRRGTNFLYSPRRGSASTSTSSLNDSGSAPLSPRHSAICSKYDVRLTGNPRGKKSTATPSAVTSEVPENPTFSQVPGLAASSSFS